MKNNVNKLEQMLIDGTKNNPSVAECAKLVEDVFRFVNIAMINELKILCDNMGIDIWEVIAAASTKPFGFMSFYPGPGLGGDCIPKDPFYLYWKAKQHGGMSKFIKTAFEVLDEMPNYVIGKTIRALEEKGIPIDKAKILLLGVSYKKDSPNINASPALKIIELLLHHSAQVDYSDPLIPSLNIEFPSPVEPTATKYNRKSIAITKQSLKRYNCVVILTDHSSFDYELIKDNCSVIVDTRNVFSASDKFLKNMVQA